MPGGWGCPVTRSTDLPAVTAGHYAIVRVLLGCYLTIHFAHLLPYGAELFSADGVLPADLSPLLGIVPNPLAAYDTPAVVLTVLWAGVVSGLLLAAGTFDRAAAVAAATALGWLYARNPLIANPSLPVVGWMLIAHAFTPVGAYGAWSSRGEPERWLAWRYPRAIWFSAWLMLAVAYSYSGYTKLLSPSWVDGTAIQLVLENPLARDHFLRSFMLGLPPIALKLLTWFVLLVELLFVPLCFHRAARMWAWIAMLLVQFGFLVFLNFADLTFPMLLIHMLTFDRRWVENMRPAGSAILFYDGACAFCNGFVRFLLAEDADRRLAYSPLQGATFETAAIDVGDDDSIVLLTPDGRTLFKSDAAIHCLRLLGGVWLLIGRLLAFLPRRLRDRVYDTVGAVRYRLAGEAAADACLLLPQAYRKQLLE